MPDGVLASAKPPLLTRLRRHLGLIIALTVGGLLVGLLVGLLQPKSYTAESRVFLSSQASFDALGGDFASEPTRYLDLQAGVMTSRTLLAEAVKGGAPARDAQELQDALEVVPSAESDVLTVRATAGDPEQATERVDKVIEAFRDYQVDLVQKQLKAVESVSNAGEKRLAQQRAAVFGDGVQLVEDASVTTSTSAIGNATVLALAGLLLGSAIALARDTGRDRRDRAARRQKQELRVAAGWPDPDDGSDRAETGADHGSQTLSPEHGAFGPSAPGNSASWQNVETPESVRSVQTPSRST
jgi:capsular polysaccharide biosynthesis protein